MKIYVGNLSFQTTESDLKAAFAAHGNVQSAAVVTDRMTGQPRGFGFVEMADADAQRAIAALNGSQLGGRQINVNEAKPRADAGGGGRR